MNKKNAFQKGLKNFTHLHVHTHYSILDSISKIPDLIDKAVADGMTAGKLFDDMAVFGKYTFNKFHAVCYSLIAYQTAYLKAHFQSEFMVALEKYKCA